MLLNVSKMFQGLLVRNQHSQFYLMWGWLTNKKTKNRFRPREKVMVENGNLVGDTISPSLGVVHDSPKKIEDPTFASLSFRRRAKREKRLSTEEEMRIGELCHISDDLLRDEYGIADPSQGDAIIDKMTMQEFVDHIRKIRERRKKLLEIQEREVAGTA